MMVDCITIPQWLVNVIHFRNAGLIDADTVTNVLHYLAYHLHLNILITHGSGDCIIN